MKAAVEIFLAKNHMWVKDVEKMRAQGKKLERTMQLEIFNRVEDREFVPVVCGKFEGYADYRTGTVYDKDGKCMSSSNLRLVVA